MPWTACVRIGFQRIPRRKTCLREVPPVARGPALGTWAGPQLPACRLLHPPSESDLKEPTCLDSPEKKLIQQTSIFFPPDSPFFWEFTPCAKRRLKALLFSPALWALPQPGRCGAPEPFHPPNSCLPLAGALLHAAAPSQVTAHRSSCAIRTLDAPRLHRMVSEHCHPTPIVTHHVSRPHGAGYLLVAGNPPPFSTDAGSHPTDGRNARRLTADSSRGRSGHGDGT